MVTSVFDETGAEVISATRRIFSMQSLKPSYLDTVAELEALVDASDIYATRPIFLYVTEKKNKAITGGP